MKYLLVLLLSGSALLSQVRPLQLNGMFVQLESLTAESLTAYLDEQAGIGIDTVLTVGTLGCQGSPYAQGAPFDSRYSWFGNQQQLLPVLLTQARIHGMKVYLGLLNTEQCADLSGDAAESATLAGYLLANYQQYGPIAGWYIPDESYLMGPDWLQSEIEYFGPVVAAIRTRSTLPILESPYLVSYSPFLASEGDPAAAAATAKQFLEATGIDILVYEDGAGGRRSNGAVKWNSYPTAGDYFRAISAAVGPAHLWIVHELNNDTFGVDGGEGSESITRLNQQMAMVPDALVGTRLTWTQQAYMSAVAPERGPEAARLLAGYRATHGFGGVKLAAGEILWLVPTTPAQPYLSTTLKDGVVGDPFAPNGPEWVGAAGSSALILDMWSTYTIDWVSLHVARDKAAGIEIPQKIVLWGSADGVSWTYLTERAFSATPGFDGEWAIGNVEPMGAVMRFVWIYLPNTGQTRISEIEVVVR